MATGAAPATAASTAMLKAELAKKDAKAKSAQSTRLFEKWKQEGARLAKQHSTSHWQIADWMVKGEDIPLAEKKHRYDAAEEITGLERETLRDMAYVGRNVLSSVRTDTLSFFHHKLVAQMKPAEQKKWLDIAVRKKLSVHALRQAIGEAIGGGSTVRKSKASQLLHRAVAALFSKEEMVLLTKYAQRQAKSVPALVHDTVLKIVRGDA